jgi:hypothetical protein
VTAAPQPAPTPPSGPSSGVGTPGTAETGTGPREAGRLDRILAEQAQRQWFPAERRDLMQQFDDAMVEVERLRAMVVALEGENAALTDALNDGRHEFEGSGPVPDRCDYLLAEDDDGCPVLCLYGPGDPIHRTAARVRAELEAGS